MTRIQKALLAPSLVILAGAGVYETITAARLQQQLVALQQEGAPLRDQLSQLKLHNQALSNQLARANPGPVTSTQRIRELLKLRGEVGLLRRRQRELEQALAGASKANQGGSQTAPGEQPIPRSPFQVQLVLDGPAEDSQSLTNDSSGSHGEILQVQKTPLMDYTAIRSASVSQDTASGSPLINIEFSPEGQELFAAVTRENLNRRLAIVLDGRVFSAPVIRSEITGGKALISGDFTEEEARELAARISDAIPGK